VGAGWRCRARCRSSLPGSIRRHKSVRTTGEWKAGGAWGSLAWLYVRPRVGRLVQNISTARRFYTPVTLWDHRQAARYSRATTITTNNNNESSMLRLRCVALPRLPVLFLALLLAACGGRSATSSSPATPQVDATTDAATAPVRRFGAITRERLLAADDEPGQWLTTGRDAGKGHYSPLDQIDRT